MISQADSLLRALSWALAHSIWQGALAAIVLLLLLPRFRTARQKYRAAYGALIGLLLLAIGTVCWYYEPSTSNGFSMDSQGASNAFEGSEGSFSLAFQKSMGEQCAA